MPQTLTQKARLKLIKEVYLKCYDETESFDRVGMYVAYLLGGIVTNDGYTLFADLCEDEQAFYDLLKEHFPSDHQVWKFIEVLPEDTDP